MNVDSLFFVFCFDGSFLSFFSLQTDCWVADPEEVYIRGKVLSAGDTCEVQTAKAVSEASYDEQIERRTDI